MAVHRNGTSWILPSAFGAGLALLQAFWVVVWGTISAETTRLQKEIDRLYERSEESFTKKDNTEQYRQRVQVEFAQLRAATEQIVVQIRRLRDENVSKDAYNGKHEALIDDLKRTNLRVDELRRDFGASYTLSDKIKELQDQIKQVQARTFAVKEH